MSGRPRQASGGVVGAQAFADWLNDSRVRGWRKRPLRPHETSLLPFRVVPVYRVKALSRPMPAEAGA